MNNETEQIFTEQLGKLPKEVVDFISSANWDTDLDEIGSLYNLSEEELSNFKREVTLVLAGLVHPDEFGSMLEQEVGIHGAVLDAIVNATEQKIFAPVRPALIEFFESETRNDAEQTQTAAEEALVAPTSPSVVSGQLPVVPHIPPIPLVPNVPPASRMPDVAPDNLPTGEEPESFLPPLQPKSPNLGVELPSKLPSKPAHPFEEKMKRVFTAGQQSMGDLTLEPAPPSESTQPQILVPTAPTSARVYHADPYREPVE
ncbi:MAG: hypothetical protein HZB12_02860 [Candidatus Yonathbacteria bacterium]|nr:hypothetical protein [Candidatus Yonathbacteria bacterium]